MFLIFCDGERLRPLIGAESKLLVDLTMRPNPCGQGHACPREHVKVDDSFHSSELDKGLIGILFPESKIFFVTPK
jgi:hypothetical protein